MKITFDMNTKHEDITQAVQNGGAILTVSFITGEILVFDMLKSTYDTVVGVIENKVNMLKDTLSEMIAADEHDSDDDEAKYDAMYQDWLAEQENRYDAEDAVLHHCFA